MSRETGYVSRHAAIDGVRTHYLNNELSKFVSAAALTPPAAAP